MDCDKYYFQFSRVIFSRPFDCFLFIMFLSKIRNERERAEGAVGKRTSTPLLYNNVW